MFQLVLHNWCNKCHGMSYLVSGIILIKYLLLLIRNSSTKNGSSRIPIFIIRLYHSSKLFFPSVVLFFVVVVCFVCLFVFVCFLFLIYLLNIYKHNFFLCTSLNKCIYHN